MSNDQAMRVVPREPTEEMYAAANREWDGRMSARSAGVWQAMYDAAPDFNCPNNASVKFLLEQADDLAHDAERARKICEPERAEGLEELEGKYRAAAAAIAPRVAAPEPVGEPVAPTREMLDAGWIAFRDSNKPAPYNQFADGLRAAIAAAPEPVGEPVAWYVQAYGITWREGCQPPIPFPSVHKPTPSNPEPPRVTMRLYATPQPAGEGRGLQTAPVEHLFVVRHGTALYAGYPTKTQAEVYASGFSSNKDMKIEMMLLQPTAHSGGEQ